VGCGINDAHRESHRNRFLLEQLKPITLLQRFAPVLMKVKGCNKERGQVHERPLPTRSTDRNGSISVVRGNISTDEDVDDVPRISFEVPSATDGGTDNQAEF
jgi:hypothetical protein